MLLWLVAIYLLASIAIGLLSARKVHNAKDYITAGRTLPLGLALKLFSGFLPHS